MVEKSLGIHGDEILYVGDHIFTDVSQSKVHLRWRTALICRELEDEVSYNLPYGGRCRNIPFFFFLGVYLTGVCTCILLLNSELKHKAVLKYVQMFNLTTKYRGNDNFYIRILRFSLIYYFGN